MIFFTIFIINDISFFWKKSSKKILRNETNYLFIIIIEIIFVESKFKEQKDFLNPSSKINF